MALKRVKTLPRMISQTLRLDACRTMFVSPARFRSATCALDNPCGTYGRPRSSGPGTPTVRCAMDDEHGTACMLRDV